MSGDSTELDRLLEEGLLLYGQGDVDGALRAWERVLAAEPHHRQATSYVQYVRSNYRMLTSDQTNEPPGPFGIGPEEPEYQIEVMPGEVPAAPAAAPPAPMYMDPGDAGWVIEAERARARVDDPNEPLTLELEADEPDEPTDGGEVGFDDATREYGMMRPAEARPSSEGIVEATTTEFSSEGTPGFGSPQDVQSFGTQITGVRQRDTGFVRPTRESLDGSASAAEPRPEPRPELRAATRSMREESSELEITLRTPSPAPSAPRPRASSSQELAYAELEIETATGHRLPLPDPLGGQMPPDPPSHLEPSASEPLELAPSGALGTLDLAVSATETTDFEPPTQERSRFDALVSAPTRELGLRPPSTTRAPTEDQPTFTAGQPVELEASPPPRDASLDLDPIAARGEQILEEIDRGAPTEEDKDDRTRRRIHALLDHAARWANAGDLDRAVTAVDLALAEDPNSALAQKLVHRNRETILSVFQAFLGDLDRMPELARPLHELGSAPISPRAAFLLSRIDGTLSLDEILDVSGMPRLEAYRHLSQLFLRGILR